MKDYISYEELTNLLKRNDIQNEEKVLLQVAYTFLKDDKLQGCLEGAYSLYINNLLFGQNSSNVRKTKDLDFSIKNKDHFPEILKEWSELNHFKIINKKQTKEGNFKIRLEVPSIEQINIVNIDIVFSKQVEEKSVSGYNIILKEKLNLKLRLMDRRLKDLIDVVLGFRNFYPDGITKEEILSMIENHRQIVDVCNKENFESCISQAKSFNPKTISGISIEEYVSEFFSMLEGLTDNNIRDDFVFINGYWERRTKKP